MRIKMVLYRNAKIKKYIISAREKLDSANSTCILYYTTCICIMYTIV